jgi:tetratricopeptide (TPR) repeat protein
MRQIELVFSALSFLIIVSGCSRSPQHYVSRGNQLFDAGKHADASLQYRKALQKDPKFGEAYYRLGLAELKVDKALDAYRALTRAAELMPGNEEVRASLGDVSLALFIVDPRHSKPFYEQLAKAAQDLLAKDPNSFHGSRLKAAVALIDRNPKEAVEYYRRADRVKPMDPDVILGLVQALILDNKPQEGERLGLQLIQGHRNFGAIYSVLHRHYLATNRVVEAENILKLKVNNNPKQAVYVLELARYYTGAGKSVEMAATLQRLVDNPGDFPQRYLQIGDFYNGLGMREQAALHFEEGLGAYPKDKVVYQRKIVEIQAAQGKWDEALKLIEAILKEQPKDAAARTARATLWLEARKPEKLNDAVGEFQVLIQQKPQDASLRFNLGRALERKGDSEGARKQLLEAVRYRPAFLEPRFALAEISLGHGKPQEAMAAADEILRYSPNNPRGRYLRAIALTRSGLFDKAHSELDQLLREFPKSGDIQLQLGMLAVAERKYKEAERIFQKLQMSGTTDPRITVGLATAYTSQNQSARALQLLQDDLKKSSAPVLRTVVAMVAAQAGKYDLALEQCQQLIASKPKAVEPLVLMSEVYVLKSDIAKAITALEKAMEVAPTDPAVALMLGDRLYQAGRADQAKANYRRVLQLRPDNAAALNNLAFAIADSGGDLDEALRLAQRAVRAANQKLDFADTLGWIYLKKKLHDPALHIFNDLVKKRPDNPSFQYHLGAAFAAKGDKEKARAALNTALAKKPGKDEEIKIKELLTRLG